MVKEAHREGPIDWEKSAGAIETELNEYEDIRDISKETLHQALTSQTISVEFGEHFKPINPNEDLEENLKVIAASVPYLIHGLSLDQSGEESPWIPELEGIIQYEGIVADFVDIKTQPVSIDSIRALNLKQARETLQDTLASATPKHIACLLNMSKVAGCDVEEAHQLVTEQSRLALMLSAHRNVLIHNHQKAAFTPYHSNVQRVQEILEKQARHSIRLRYPEFHPDSEEFVTAVHNMTRGMMYNARQSLAAFGNAKVIRFSPEELTSDNFNNIMKTPLEVRDAFLEVKRDIDQRVKNGELNKDDDEKEATITFLKKMNAWPKHANMRKVQSAMNQAVALYQSLLTSCNEAIRKQTPYGESAPLLDTNTSEEIKSFWRQIELLYNKEERNGLSEKDLMDANNFLVFWTTFWRQMLNKRNDVKHKIARKLSQTVEQLSHTNRQTIQIDRYQFVDNPKPKSSIRKVKNKVRKALGLTEKNPSPQYQWVGTTPIECVVGKEDYNNKEVLFYRNPGTPKGLSEIVLKLVEKDPHLYDEQVKDTTRTREYCMSWTTEEVAADPNKITYLKNRLREVAHGMGISKERKFHPSEPKAKFISDPEETFGRHRIDSHSEGEFMIEIDLNSKFPVAKLVGYDRNRNNFEYQIGFLDTYITENAENSPIDHKKVYAKMRAIRGGKVTQTKSIVDENVHERLDAELDSIKTRRKAGQKAQKSLNLDIQRRRDQRLAA